MGVVSNDVVVGVCFEFGSRLGIAEILAEDWLVNHITMMMDHITGGLKDCQAKAEFGCHIIDTGGGELNE